MRGIIDSLFGWDAHREEKNFAGFFKLNEVRIITADGQDVGWIQEQVFEKSINLGSFYIGRAMQGRGIGGLGNASGKGSPRIKRNDIGSRENKPSTPVLRKARVPNHTPRRA